MKELPRGIRNNNPGNIILNNIKWQGRVDKSKQTDTHFVQFAEPLFGLRALARDLMTKINNKVCTPRAIIYKYAPENENNTAEYVKRVCKLMAMNADDVLSTDTDTIFKLMKAIIAVENGDEFKDYYADSLINTAIQLARKQ